MARNDQTRSSSVAQCISPFLEHAQVVEGLSANTIMAYQTDLEQFSGGVSKSVSDIKMKDIQKFVSNSLSDLSSKTQARKLATLNKFFRFCVRRGWIAENPVTDIDRPKIGKSLPKALSAKQMEALLDYVADGVAPEKIRFRLVLQLLYGGGLRISELLGLKVADINLEEEAVLRITGKGDKTRIVPIGDIAASTLRQYLELSRSHLGTKKNGVKSSPWLFPSPYKIGAPMTRQRFFQLVQEAGQNVGISDLSPHMLRHTFATHLVEGRADLRAVQMLLGHANMETTQIYTKVVTSRLRSALEESHPLAKLSS